MTLKRLAVILGTIAATACGGPAGTPSTSTDAQTAARNYQAIGQDLGTAVAQYQSATATMQDVTACQAAEATYQAQVGPMIDRMKTASEVMDHYMDEHMGTGASDMTCVADAMELEYQRHVGAACGAATMADNETEAAHHAASMFDWMEHQRVRYEQMGAETGMMPSTTDTTWSCQQNPDGSFTMGDYTWTPPQTPPTGTDPTPTPTPWPMPCGGYGCGCGG